LFCSTSIGDKPLFFQWGKNGKILSNTPQNTYKIENLKDHSLFSIESVDRSDSGNYSCIVRNAFGEDVKYSQLIVKGLNFFALSNEHLFMDLYKCLVAPKWLIEPKDIKMRPNEDISIECRAEGEPKPFIKWSDSKGF